MIRSISKFTSVWFVVALARSEPGDAVVAVALAATELRANSVNHFSFGELGSARRPPYPTDATSMIISVDAVAIAAFHVSMGWTLPERIVDLLIEFSILNNRSDASPSAHFSAALLAFGLPPVAALRRASGASDLTDKVNATAALFERMASRIDMPRALLRRVIQFTT